MNPLLEYKRIKEAFFIKNPVNFNKTTLKKENYECEKRKKKENTSIHANRITQQKDNNRNFSLHSNQILRHEYDHNVKKINNPSDLRYRNSKNEKWKNHVEAVKKNEKIVENEDLELSLFCPDDTVSEMSHWNGGKIKSNIHSTFRDISNIMETIHSSKKKEEESKNNALLKGEREKIKSKKGSTAKKKNHKNESSKTLSSYERFYLEQVKTIKEKLNYLRDGKCGEKGQRSRRGSTNGKKARSIKGNRKLLVNIFNEYKDLEESML
ncbi:conserved Plasmodium protein, unknown function [Plasmodium gonderi]|uniref:Uncharacterized protein n=1 Tax=Plasmodium gonderi TaxID=77519 RepID=A0A1Y1JG30_PLAGO|nr:conserved Plasmodium protein, unknown function [Plasmodium gonderi]GAW81220.1 conserved Plasmodium protein, unknown function [Plasmodium gonderi]